MYQPFFFIPVPEVSDGTRERNIAELRLHGPFGKSELYGAMENVAKKLDGRATFLVLEGELHSVNLQSADAPTCNPT